MKNSFLFIACIYLLQTYNSLNAQVTNKHYFGAEAGIYLSLIHISEPTRPY